MHSNGGKDAKKAYIHANAAVLRGKDSVMKTVSSVKENCGDIYADAKDINEKRYEQDKETEIERAKAIIEEYENPCESQASESEE